MTKTITVLSGDGIGAEICYEATRVLNAAIAQSEHVFNYEFKDFGGSALIHYGSPFPFDARSAVNGCDAVLLGVIGSPIKGYDKTPRDGFDALLVATGAYARLQPIKIHPELVHLSPLKAEYCNNTDILIVRELSGGIYCGKNGNAPDGSSAFDTEEYSGPQIQRIAELAFEQALLRKKQVCSVDKADKLESSKLWRRCVDAVSKSYPEVELTHMLIEDATAKMVTAPNQFDVILCPNMFGDILGAQASALSGATGTLPSAYIGKTDVFQPVFGSEAFGENSSDPIGAIKSVAMLLDRLNLKQEAKIIEAAIERTLQDGIFTKDLNRNCVTCSEMADAIIKRL